MATLNHHIRAIVIALVIVFLSFAVPSHAEKVTFVKEYTYQASELDSKASCRTISLEMVKRLLLEELGTYLISETEVKDFKLTKEQVKTYSAGIVGAEIIEDKWDGKTYWLKAKVSADPKEVAKSLKKIMNDQFKARELEETRKKAEELVKENERLRKELELAKKSGSKDEKAEAKKAKEYEKTIKGLAEQAESERKTQKCISQINERTSALVAKDWRQLERLSRRYIHDCKGAFDSKNLAGAFEDIVIANMELNNIEIALKESQKCIDFYYDNLGCHVLKTQALIRLGRIPEARDEFNLAKRLLDYQLKMNERNQQTALYQTEKKLLRALGSRLDFLHSILD